MKKKKVNTHIVIKREDALKYLPEPAYQTLEKLLYIISEGRNKDGKKPCNTYYICNTDEPYAEVVHGIIMGGEAVKEKNTQEKKRLVMSDEDCSDCLCRVCARNSSNDSRNNKLKNGIQVRCECNCRFGDELVETGEDCPNFLPDDDAL